MFQNSLCVLYRSLLLLFRCQVEALLASEDYGKDLASVNNLLKKHQLLEADISAHEVSRGRGAARPVPGCGCACGKGEGCPLLKAEARKHCSLGTTSYLQLSLRGPAERVSSVYQYFPLLKGNKL